MRRLLPLLALCSPLTAADGDGGLVYQPLVPPWPLYYYWVPAVLPPNAGAGYGAGSILHISEQQFKNGHVTSRSFKNEDQPSSSSVPAEEFSECSGDTSDSFHNYFTEDLEKENNISLSDYRGNVLLVVNLASF